MTRAQALLIVVGDPIILSLDPLWRNFLNYIHMSGGWRGLPKDWSDDEDHDSSRNYLQERRNDVRGAIDDLAARLEAMVIEQLPEGTDGEDDADDAVQDKPWREDE